MSLPDRWIEKIFARMLVRYGSAWLRMWEGVDEAAIKADWALQLAGYVDNPKALEHALGHLPADKPPTVAQFALLCRNAPRPSLKRLAAPIAPAERRQEVVDAVHTAFRSASDNERKRTVERIKARQAQGLPLSQLQRDTLRDLQARDGAA